ncbi:MAG: hypothetical protein S4CHLAM2_08300 [Chlamydiales bacterium]|nr:hypothetical protein [Chlamydiales bacterium]
MTTSAQPPSGPQYSWWDWIPGVTLYKNATQAVVNVNQMSARPDQTAALLVQGAVAGYGSTGNASTGGGSAAGGPPNVTQGNALLTGVTALAAGSMTDASVFVLEKLLENAEIIDPHSSDIPATTTTTTTAPPRTPTRGQLAVTSHLKERCLGILKNARTTNGSLPDAAKQVWSILDSYHIVAAGGVNINAKSSASPALKVERFGENQLEAAQNDGSNPISDLVECQDRLNRIRTHFHLQPPVETSPPSSSAQPIPLDTAPPLSPQQLRALQAETDAVIARFCEKTLHLSTMYAMITLFGHEIDPIEILSQANEETCYQDCYLNAVGGGRLRQLIYKNVYRLILAFITPMIEKTISEVMTHLREFLNDNVSLLGFTELKINQLADYYARVERGRQEYVRGQRPGDPGYQAGSFDTFLEHTITRYGRNELTREQVIKKVGDYLINNFTPRPTVTIRGYRIPLISRFLEWIIHSCRKLLIRALLNRTDMIQNALAQGTGSSSIHHAQLGLKQMLLKKLKEIKTNLERARYQRTTDNKEVDERMILEARKARIITLRLHQAIAHHSTTLHRFIEIEACNQDPSKLSTIDNQIVGLTQELMEAIKKYTEIEVFSRQQVLEDATTNMLETALISLFEGKERQVEEQMRGVIEIFERAYAFTPPGKRERLEAQYRADCSQADHDINSLLEQLSQVAIKGAIQDHLKNASAEKHERIKAFVEKQKEEIRRCAADVAAIEERFTVDEHNAHQLKDELNRALSKLEAHLRKISAIMRSPDLTTDCYSDTRGDLYNGYASLIKQIDHVAEQVIEPALVVVGEMAKLEKKLSKLEREGAVIGGLDVVNLPVDQALIQINSLTQTQAVMDMRAQWVQLGELEVERDWAQLVQEREQYITTDSLLRSLATTLRAWSDLRGTNRTYPTQAVVNQRRQELVVNIERLRDQLLAIENDELQNSVLSVLQGKNAAELQRLINPSWNFGRRATIFTDLDVHYQYLEEMPPTPHIRALTSVNAEMDRVCEQIEQACAAIHATTVAQIDHLKTTLIPQKRTRLQQIKRGLEGVSKSVDALADELDVKGCIVFGHLKITQNLDRIVALITPQILRTVGTLITSLGKSFHYEQLAVRIFLLDLAKEINYAA